MNKYQETLKRLEGMVLTSPFKNDVGDGVIFRKEKDVKEIQD